MSRRRRLTVAVLAAAGALVAVDEVRRVRAWSKHEDPVRPEEWDPVPGRAFPVAAPDGARIAVTVAGENSADSDGRQPGPAGPEGHRHRPSVVLAHGWSSHSRMWAPVAHRLVTSGCRVVLYDERGHGESTLGQEGTSTEALGDDLAAVMDATDVHDAVIVGHSMGGIAVLSALQRHPDLFAQRARALLLVSTGCSDFGNGILERQLAGLMASPVVNRALGGRLGYAWVRRAEGKQAVREHLIHTCEDTRACDPGVRSGFLTAMFATDLGSVLDSINLPTTVMVGSADHITPPRQSRRLAEGIGGARLITLEGRGHMLPLEAPAEVVDAILAARQGSGEPDHGEVPASQQTGAQGSREFGRTG